MVMSTQGQLYIPGFQKINDAVIIAHVFCQGVVVDKNNRHFFGNGLQQAIQPNHAFTGYKCRGHPHIGPGIGAYEQYVITNKGKLFVTEGFQERIAAAFGPFGVVVA